jgi:HK97 family phage major capsid protein
LTVNIPKLTGPAGATVQSLEGAGLTDTDPTGTLISANVQTFASMVPVSQQLFDRADPSMPLDVWLYAQMRQELDAQIDQAVIAAALGTGSGTVTDTKTTANTVIGDFYGDVRQGASLIENSAGSRIRATHCFMTPTQFRFPASQLDGSSRPLLVPSPAGANLPMVRPDDNTNPPGATGYDVAGITLW